MKFLLVSFVLFVLLLGGCNREESNPITPPVDDRVSFEINFLQYSDNNYFIDEVYTHTSAEFNMYNLYYGSLIPTVLPKYFVKDFEVYISINRIDQTLNSIAANAYIDLPPRTSSNMYSDSLRYNNIFRAGQEESARFRLLNEGGDYIFHPETGYITFLFPLMNQEVIAVAYRIENDSPSNSDDLFYGEFIAELINNSKTTGVLKLVKPSNLQPFFESAWKLKMKNIYQITPYTEQATNLDLDIYLKKSDGSESNTIYNVGLLELFGFDKLTENRSPGSDGKFDNRIGINFEPRTSEIIFPVIQPFGKNIPSMLNGYKYQAIYDTIKTYLSLPDNSFIIKGKYKPI
jgi:cell surface protein SprA